MIDGNTHLAGKTGNATRAPAQLDLTLSANQQAFEDLILGPTGARYEFLWNLNYSGPQTSGVNYAWSDFAVQAQSPLTHGPQTTSQTAPANMAATLAFMTGTPLRILKNGAILVLPTTQSSSTASYVGSDVRIDFLAVDNATVAWSQIRTDYVTVPLTGVLAGSSTDFAHFHNSFFSNAAILKPASTYLAGAGYIKYTATARGDRYSAFDCAAATTDASINPCRTGMTLSDALTTGLTSVSDATTYVLADGIVGTVGGVPVWVATVARPQSSTLSSTPQYRTYFELNGNVYSGSLIKDGAVLGGSYYVSNPAGATVADRLLVLHTSPLPPALLLAGLVTVVLARRRDIGGLLSRMRR